MLALLIAALPLGFAPGVEQETWRAWFDVPGGELPFGIELSQDDEAWTGALVNGDGRVPFDVVKRNGDELLLELSAYDSRIRATLDESGDVLTGTWEKVRGPDKVARLPFHAMKGEHLRFPIRQRAVLPKNFAGRWAVDFESDELGSVGVFRQEVGSPHVTGTFLTHTGDYRWLAGNVEGNELRLSCFDGGHAFLFKAELQPDGTLKGDFWSGDWWHETWTARRDASAVLGDAFEQTTWTDRPALANLVFPDLNGHLRSLAEPEYAGKAYLLQIFGSWCPNCHDETRYLVELHERYKDRGLSIISLAFELTGDAERDREQVHVFRERYGVEYPTFLVGTSGKKLATQAFGYVDFVRSYPTTIFMRPDGSVKAVHSGFVGAATGAEHEKLREEFELLIEGLLSETASASGDTWRRLNGRPWFSTPDEKGRTHHYFFGEQDGIRVVKTAVESGGVASEARTVPVGVDSRSVWIDERLWAFDPEADVLLDPYRIGFRLVPGDATLAPVLDRLGIDQETEIVGALADGDPLVRREAVFGLVATRSLRGEPRVPEVVALLDDASLDVRLAAVWAAGEGYEDAAIERLFELLEHPNAMLRLTTLRSLTRMGRRNGAILLRLKTVEDDPVQKLREHLEDTLGPGGYWSDD